MHVLNFILKKLNNLQNMLLRLNQCSIGFRNVLYFLKITFIFGQNILPTISEVFYEANYLCLYLFYFNFYFL